jgi:ankyrin repeat protein
MAIHDKATLALLSTADQARAPGTKSVKKLKFVAAVALALSAAPAAAQLNSSAKYDFIKAVEESDGAKATQLLSENPSGLADARNEEGDTALIVTIAREDPDWTGFLISKGADVNLAGRNGDTPLITAARVGFEDAVRWLLGRGARVDGANRMGETPLIVAVQQRQARIVKELLEAGADPDKTDSAAGLSARDYAARDTRSRQMLQLIEAKKPKSSAAAAAN